MKMAKQSNTDGMTHLAVPNAHMQSINSQFKQVHSGSAPRNISSSLLKADPVKLKVPEMPDKNPGMRKLPF